MLGLKPGRKIYAKVYANFYRSSKDYLIRETNAIFPTRSLFFQNNSSKQKSFHLSARGLHDECSIHIHLCRNHLPWAFTTGILKKTQHWGIFPRVCSYNQMHCDFKPWWLFGRWLLCSILQVEVYHPLITSHILFVKDFKNLRRKWPRKVSFAK